LWNNSIDVPDKINENRKALDHQYPEFEPSGLQDHFLVSFLSSTVHNPETID